MERLTKRTEHNWGQRIERVCHHYSDEEKQCYGCAKRTACNAAIFDRLAYYEDMEEQGRLVVLDESRKPLIWGDDNHDTILCPNCKRDLMGGFELEDSCEATMIQCPRCGQPIDGTKVLTREEAENALKGGAK